MNSWQKLIGYKPKEFMDQELKILQGEIPKTLKGTLFRNTVAIIQRKNGLAGHLFDGDGVILKVEFQGDGKQPVGSYKFVQNEWFIEEEKRDELIYKGLGRLHTGNRLTKIWNNNVAKNAANTSVLPLMKGPLLALWEGGFPTSLDKKTLQTLGLFDGGMLKQGESYSAHHKVDPTTNLIYNIGIIRGKTPQVMVTEMDQTGKILKANRANLYGQVFVIHDFVFVANYMVVFAYPQFLDSLIDHFTAAKPLSENVAFKPEAGVQILIFDIKKNLELIANHIEKDSWFAWHYANGYINQEGLIEITQGSYKNFDSFFALKVDTLLAKGVNTDTFCSWYEKILINPKDGKVVKREKLYDDQVEFLVVPDLDVGQPTWDTTYACLRSRNDDYFDTIVKYTKNERKVKTYEIGQYVSEPLHVQDPIREKGQGWLLYTIYDGRVHKTFVEIADAVTLNTICLMELPEAVGISFHGRFDLS